MVNGVLKLRQGKRFKRLTSLEGLVFHIRFSNPVMKNQVGDLSRSTTEKFFGLIIIMWLPCVSGQRVCA